MYCKKCGGKLDADSVFCSSCGTRVNDDNYVEEEDCTRDDNYVEEEVNIDIKNIFNNTDFFNSMNGFGGSQKHTLLAIKGLNQSSNRNKLCVHKELPKRKKLRGIHRNVFYARNESKVKRR